jgi:16S rRNA (cytosine967-C5)-methyltransferase
LSALARRSVSPARRCAFKVVLRVFEQGAYADRALASEAVDLDPRERALATRIAYGTVQRRATLDAIAQRLASRPLRRIQPAALAALRLGLFQLLLLDGIPEHAAVNETVELAKSAGSPAAAFVNAVMRRAAREGPSLLAQLNDATPAAAAVLHSVPTWLAEQLWRELGADEARALLATCNEPPESAMRVNTLVATPAEVVAALPVAASPAMSPADGRAATGQRAELPEGLVLAEPFDIQGSELWRRGAIMGQSRGSMAVARMLEPQLGERVLDLCAAPGAKTTHLAALAADRGEILAVERHPGRARALARTCERMRSESVQVQVGDATRRRSGPPFDRVLLDPPCSGLGTLQSRPDIRWRMSPAQIKELAHLQRRMLRAAAAATGPGSVLVYSVCTVSRSETTGVLDAFTSDQPEFILDQSIQLLPHRDGTDGFFIARLHRR